MINNIVSTYNNVWRYTQKIIIPNKKSDYSIYAIT